MTGKLLREVLDNIKVFDRRFEIREVQVLEDGIVNEHGFLVRVAYEEADIYTGKVETQRSREWYVPGGSSESEVVHTAFAAVMRSYDHVVQEHFTYKGKRVYSPHFDIEARLKMAENV